MSTAASRSLDGRVAVVTGGTRGIGLAIARRLLDHGAAVVVTGRDRGRTLERAAALGERAAGEALDVADPASVRSAFAAIRARHPRIDILVNNAGEAASAPFARTELDLWQRMLAVNLTGTFLCTREVLPAMMRERAGRVVNVASTAGLTGYAYVSAYVASKHGVIGLTRSLALEAARTGVTVNAVCPGYTETDLTRETVAKIAGKTGRSESEALASITAVNPQGRLVQPEEVAQAVIWLCGPDSAAINGQAIAIAGGEVMTG